MKKAIILIGIILSILLSKMIFEHWYFDKERTQNRQLETWNNRIGSFVHFKEYVPRVFNGDSLVEVPRLLTQKHQENVIKVLTYHHETWKLENGELLVPRELDDEILWNYTTKANDSIWLQEHK